MPLRFPARRRKGWGRVILGISCGSVIRPEQTVEGLLRLPQPRFAENYRLTCSRLPGGGIGVAHLDHVGCVAGEYDLDGGEWVVPECCHRAEITGNPVPGLGLEHGLHDAAAGNMTELVVRDAVAGRRRPSSSRNVL